MYRTLYLPVLFILFLFISGCNGPKNKLENPMTVQNLLDSPEVSQVLFHPGITPETSPPAGGKDMNI
jgi:hypothetical protein